MHVITFDAASARYNSFRESNPHLLPSLQRWGAVDGSRLPRAAMAHLGVADQELLARRSGSGSGTGSAEKDTSSSSSGKKTKRNTEFLVSAGALGAALSHRRVWRRAVAVDAPVLVVEDDVITHPGILQYAADHDAALRAADITLCSLNQDAFFVSTDTKNITAGGMAEPAYPSAAWIRAALAATDPEKDVQAHRLSLAFGLGCYWVSPQGAARLLEEAFPLPDAPIFQPPGVWPPQGRRFNGTDIALQFFFLVNNGTKIARAFQNM